jgi:hypothetical protein
MCLEQRPYSKVSKRHSFRRAQNKPVQERVRYHRENLYLKSLPSVRLGKNGPSRICLCALNKGQGNKRPVSVERSTARVYGIVSAG